jgi:isopentenyldiphosphate isomerase
VDQVVVVNDDDEVIGTMAEEEAHRQGVRHRIAVTYVENHAGEILIQIRRSGSHDHSCAGHVEPGESYLDTAVRELREELGIAGVPLDKIGHSDSSERRPEDASFKVHEFDIFCCQAEPGALQESEVRGVYWSDPDNIVENLAMERSEIKYAGGFLASLPVYMDWRRARK